MWWRYDEIWPGTKCLSIFKGGEHPDIPPILMFAPGLLSTETVKRVPGPGRGLSLCETAEISVGQVGGVPD